MRTVKGWLGAGLGLAGFIWCSEEEPYVGEKFLIPEDVRGPLKIPCEVAIVTGYYRRPPYHRWVADHVNSEFKQHWWALYLRPAPEDPCNEEFMKDISS